MITPKNNDAIPPTSLPTNEQRRLEILMRQKEQERKERERMMWREASKPPKVFGEDEVPDQQQPPAEGKIQSGSLFSRLKLGKFLE
jgi:hypothetical protein